MKLSRAVILIIVLALVIAKFLCPNGRERIQNAFSPLTDEIGEYAPAARALGQSITDGSDAIYAWWHYAEN